MIINRSGIALRIHVADIRVAGRATQGVRLINLEKRADEIASVCIVPTSNDEEAIAVDGEELPQLSDENLNAVVDDTNADDENNE